MLEYLVWNHYSNYPLFKNEKMNGRKCNILMISFALKSINQLKTIPRRHQKQQKDAAAIWKILRVIISFEQSFPLCV